MPVFAKCGTRLFTAAIVSMTLAACGGGAKYRPVSDATVRIGPPYKVRGITYTPAADPGYDMLGYATWYGSESGNQTANGERFRPDWYTAAHRTLPLPTYVEVTSLDTGRRIIVRVNDRGPFTEPTRIIDLSRGAAELLGIRGRERLRCGCVPSSLPNATARPCARARPPVPCRRCRHRRSPACRLSSSAAWGRGEAAAPS